MGKLLFITAFVSFAAFINTAQATCDKDTLDEVSSDGDILITGRRVASSSECAIRPRERETGSTEPQLFAHWPLCHGNGRNIGSRVNREVRARFWAPGSETPPGDSSATKVAGFYSAAQPQNAAAP